MRLLWITRTPGGVQPVEEKKTKSIRTVPRTAGGRAVISVKFAFRAVEAIPGVRVYRSSMGSRATVGVADGNLVQCALVDGPNRL